MRLSHPAEEISATSEEGLAWASFSDYIPWEKLYPLKLFNSELESTLSCVVNEYSQRGPLLDGGVRYRKNILFYGPGGSGKTEAAKWLAATAGVGLATFSLGSMLCLYPKELLRFLLTASLKDFLPPCVVALDFSSAPATFSWGSVVRMGEALDHAPKQPEQQDIAAGAYFSDWTEYWSCAIGRMLEKQRDFDGILVFISRNLGSLTSEAQARFDLVSENRKPSKREISDLLRRCLSEVYGRESFVDWDSLAARLHGQQISSAARVVSAILRQHLCCPGSGPSPHSLEEIVSAVADLPLAH